ncbi:MAG: amidase [Desulfobacterales bacterium]
MTTLSDLDLTEMIALLSKKEITATEVAESCLDAVARYEGELNAFISLDAEKVIEQSRRIDAAEDRDGGPFLFGAPVAIKDLIDAAGEVTTHGSSFFRNAPAAESDASVVAALRENGAIVFGKTNLHEFAWGGTTENPHFGNCKNPWNPDYSPGGSSGGSGAAVASRMVPGALGTDTLGSVRIPSSFCGIVGLKPTYGLISTWGVFPLGYTYDHVGPMARTVADAKRLLEAMLPPLDRQKLLRKTEGKRPKPKGDKPLKGLKIACMPELVSEKTCHKSVYKHYLKAVDYLREDGAEIVEERIPGIETALMVGYVMTLSQAAEIHHERLAENPDGFGDDVRELLESGHLFSAVDYIRAQRARSKLVDLAKRSMEKVDAWIWPTTPAPAQRIGESSGADLAMFTGPVDVIGFPSIALPSGLTDDRLPVSVQVVAEPFAEYRLFDLAAVLENRLCFPKDPPDWVKNRNR